MKNRPSNHLPQHCLTPRNDRRHTVKSLPKKRCDPLLHQTHTTHPSFILKETLRRPQWIAEKPCKYTLTIYSKSHQSGPGQYTDPVTSSLIIFMQCYHFLILPRVTNKNPQTRECINSTVNSGKWTGYFYINCMEFRMGFDGGDADSSQTCRHVDQNYERKKKKEKTAAKRKSCTKKQRNYFITQHNNRFIGWQKKLFYQIYGNEFVMMYEVFRRRPISFTRAAESDEYHVNLLLNIWNEATWNHFRSPSSTSETKSVQDRTWFPSKFLSVIILPSNA